MATTDVEVSVPPGLFDGDGAADVSDDVVEPVHYRIQPVVEDLPEGAVFDADPAFLATALPVRGPRRVRTWQVSVGAGLALIAGMMLGDSTRAPAERPSLAALPSAPVEVSTAAVTVAPSGEPPLGVVEAVSAPEAEAAPQPDPASDGQAGGPTTAQAASVLFHTARHVGPATTDPFVVASGEWTMAWAYSCANHGGSGTFRVRISQGDGGPAPEVGLDETGAGGKSVARYTGTGMRSVSVETECAWAMKIIG